VTKRGSHKEVHMAGIVAWAVAIASCFVVEGIALVRPADSWPTFSDIMRIATGETWGRWGLFAAWLWLGWHLFVRGSGSPAATLSGEGITAGSQPALVAPVALDDVVRHDVIPLVAVYALVVVVLMMCARRLVVAAGEVSSRRRAPNAVDLAVTAACGYGLFLAVVAVYYGLVADESSGFLRDAVVGGGGLAFGVALPAFALTAAARRRRARSPSG
jgi:Family of unknown function (DUF6256)/Family of unknown function (DUF6186)